MKKTRRSATMNATLEDMQARMKLYPPGKHDNQNKASIDTHISAMLAFNDGPGMGHYHLLLREKGKWFVGRKPSGDYPDCKAFATIHRPQKKQCWHNSQSFVSNYESGTYYEGYMCDGIIAVLHGWVVMGDGNVVDFTIEARDRYLKRQGMYPPTEVPVAYLGVEVPREFVMEKLAEIGHATVIAHMYHLGDHRQFMLD
jgi:hypothetical protein